MLSSLRSASYSVTPGLKRKGYPTFQPILVRYFGRRGHDSRDPRDKEPIIVEIIDNTEKHKEKMKAENITWTPPEENRFKPPSFAGSVFNFVKNSAQSVANRVSNKFFPDEETRIKNEIKKKVSAQIDASFQGGGIFGHLMKSGIKMVSSQVVSAMVDLERVKQKLEGDVEDVLTRDATSKRLLGLPVQLSDILQTSSAMGQNGREKHISQEVTYQVIGSRASGIVRATIDNQNDDAWVLRTVLVTLDGSQETYEAELTPKPDKAHIIDV